MKQYKSDTAVTIPATSKIGVTQAQFTPRAHNLSKLDESADLITCEVIRPVQFKAGEVFFANDHPKWMASLVKTEDEEDESGAGSSDKSFDSMTAKEMKAYLTEAGVEFAGNASKKVLLELCLAAVEAGEDEEDKSDDADSDDDQDD